MRGGKHGADPQADQRGRLRAAALSRRRKLRFSAACQSNPPALLRYVSSSQKIFASQIFFGNPVDLVFPCCSGCPFRGVCLAAAARKWGPQKSASVASSFLGQSFAALVYAKHTPWCQAAMIHFKIRYKKSPDMLCHRGLNLFYSDSSLRRMLSCMQRKRGSCFVCARSMPSTRRDAWEGIKIPCRLLPFCGRGLLF